MIKVTEGVRIRPENVRRNLMMLHGVNMAEAVMIDLTKTGMDRQDAHETVRVASMKALEENRPLSEVISEYPQVAALCTKERIEELLEPDNYTGTAVWQVEMIIRKLTPVTE